MIQRLGLLLSVGLCFWFACASPIDLVGIQCRKQSDCMDLYCVSGRCQASPGAETVPEPPIGESKEQPPEDAADLKPEPSPEDGPERPDVPDRVPSCQPTQLVRDFTLTGHSASIDGAAFSPKNAQQLATASRDHTIKVWDVQLGRLVATFSDPSLARPFVRISWSDSASYLFSLYGNGTSIRPALWDVVSGQRVAKVSWPSSFATIPCGVFGASDDLLWLCGEFGGTPAVVRWSLSKKNYDKRYLESHKQPLTVLARHVSAAGTYLAIGAKQGAVSVRRVDNDDKKVLIDTTDTNLKALQLAHLTELLVLQFLTHNNKVLLATQSREDLKVWDVQSGDLLGRLELPTSTLTPKTSISEDGASVVVSTDKAHVLFKGSFASDGKWSAQKLHTIPYADYSKSLNQRGNSTKGLLFQPGNARRFVDVGGRLLVWKNEAGLAAGQALAERFAEYFEAGLSGPVKGVALQADGSHMFGFAVGSSRISMWSLRSFGLVRIFEAENSRLELMAVGQKYVAATAKARLVVWEIDSGKQVLDRTEAGNIKALLFRPGTDTLVVSNGDRQLLIWKDVTNPSPVVVNAHAEKIRALSASGDGAWLASLSDDVEIRIWRWDGDALVDSFILSQKYARPYHDIAVAPDGVTVYAISKLGVGEVVDRLHLSEPSKNKEGLTPSFGGGNGNMPQGLLSLSADGKLLAIASSDVTLQLFDVSGERAVRVSDKQYQFTREVTGTQLLSLESGKLLLVAGSIDRSIRVMRCP